MKKLMILLFMLISGSVGAAIASQVLLSVDINGTVKVSTKEVTLYAAEAFNPFLSPIGEEVSTITIGDVEEGESIPLGAYYLVNTGNTSLVVTYDTLETLHDLPLYVEIEMLDVYVSPNGTVGFWTERQIQWSYDKLPSEKIWSDYTVPFASLNTFTDLDTYWINAVLMDIVLCAENVDVTEDTAFSLQLMFSG